MAMTSTIDHGPAIVIPHGHCLYRTIVMVVTAVDTHGDGLYNCGLSWSWPLLLWLLKVMTATIVATNGHGL